MRSLAFDPAALTGQLKVEWDKWEKRTTGEAQKLIDAWEKWFFDPKRSTDATFTHEFKNDIWSDLKHFLKTNVTHGNCAYCETSSSRFVGDAEHYRPKGRVSVKQNERLVKISVCVDDSGKEVIHPGYFWLAYDWQNLLPACEHCNKMQGKLDQFPVDAKHAFGQKLSPAEVAALTDKPYASTLRPGWYYLRSKDLNVLEKPLLLHPYFDNPRKHLRFGVRGAIAAIDQDKRGQATIDVLGLREDDLRTGRQRQQERSDTSFFMAYMGQKTPEQALADARLAIAGFIEGSEPYSAAALDLLRQKLPNVDI